MMKKYFILIISVVFAFAKNDNQDFRFVIVGDRTGNCIPGVFDEIIDEISALHPDFVINVGNLIHGYTEDTTAIHAQWDTVLNIMERLPCKFYFVPGNHDIQNEKTREIYEKRTGSKTYYFFDYKNSHFIILDNSITQWSMAQTMDEQQKEWLTQDIEEHKDADNIFVFFHTPAYLNAYATNIPDPLLDMFNNYRVRAIFCGHLNFYMRNLNENTELIVVGSSGAGMYDNDPAKGNFYHFLFVTVQGKDYDIAVIKKGNIFLRNVFTGSDYHALERAQQEAVTFSNCIVKDESKKTSCKCTMTINNTGIDSIIHPLMWNFDSSHYKIAPRQIPLDIGPEEEKKYKINFTISNGSDIFPQPQFALVYPFTFGKVCTLRSTLGVKRLKNIRKIKSAPVIDGRLDDKVWQKIKPISNLGSHDGQLSPAEKTEIYLCHDKNNFYIGARCFESDFSRLVAEALEHDGQTYTDDNIWFFFDSNFDKETYYQTIINSKGVVFDRLCSVKNNTRDITWNGPWQIKSGREDNAWILEIMIPKAGLEPFNEKKWGFNLRRLQTRIRNAEACWSLPFGHYPDNFGIIEFD